MVERFPKRARPQYETPPAPRIAKNVADPRLALAKAAQARGESYVALSRMLGRREGFLACFIREGFPKALTVEDHAALVAHFGHPLGIRDLWL